MIDKQFIVERNGRSFVLYTGLLDLAHRQGLRAIRTHLLQVPSEDNGQTAIVSAEVETERGTFCGVGDASPSNVARAMLTVTIRLAETRAKARALRDAVNVGVAAFEELGDLDDTAPTPIRSAVDEFHSYAKGAIVAASAPPTTSTRTAARLPLATEAQLSAISRIRKAANLTESDVERIYKVKLGGLTKTAASKLIDELQAHRPS